MDVCLCCSMMLLQSFQLGPASSVSAARQMQQHGTSGTESEHDQVGDEQCISIDATTNLVPPSHSGDAHSVDCCTWMLTAAVKGLILTKSQLLSVLLASSSEESCSNEWSSLLSFIELARAIVDTEVI